MKISTTQRLERPIGWTDWSEDAEHAAITDAAGNEWRLTERVPGELTLSLAVTGSGRLGGGVAVHPRADNAVTVMARR